MILMDVPQTTSSASGQAPGLSGRAAFAGMRVSVIGAARSGTAAAEVLANLGASVTLADRKGVDAVSGDRMRELASAGIRLVGDTFADAIPSGTGTVVTSPGVPLTAPLLEEAVRRAIPVWSEIELGYRIAEAPIAAVTGTNGKTTTTLLLAAMLNRAGFRAVAAGNVSADEVKRTLVEAAYRETAPGTVLTAEISSFQLEWTERFAPAVAILTNITPDHLNRHASFEEYAAAKARIFAVQTDAQWAILNSGNATVRDIGASGLTARIVWFGTQEPPVERCGRATIIDGVLTVQLTAQSSPVGVIGAADLPDTLPGVHSIENCLAAAAASLALGAPAGAIADAIRSFPGVPHRMEAVAEIRGVRYINNSMCTNVEAAVRSIAAVGRPAVVIAGGADKALDFAALGPAYRQHARHAVLIGHAADRIEAALRLAGFEDLSRAGSLEEAVVMACATAHAGDAVILSPGCASFDMFADFEARGEAFRRIVRRMEKDAT